MRFSDIGEFFEIFTDIKFYLIWTVFADLNIFTHANNCQWKCCRLVKIVEISMNIPIRIIYASSIIIQGERFLGSKIDLIHKKNQVNVSTTWIR